MNEDFVSFDLAKKLTLKGFNAPCIAYYDEGVLRYNTKYPFALTAEELIISHNSEYTWVDAPTISQVLKWLREEEHIFVQMGLVEYKWEYMCFDISTIADNFYGWHKAMLKGDKVRFFDSYEQAALAGIEYVIDNLI